MRDEEGRWPCPSFSIVADGRLPATPAVLAFVDETPAAPGLSCAKTRRERMLGGHRAET